MEPTVRPDLVRLVAVKRGRDAAARLPNNPEMGCKSRDHQRSLTCNGIPMSMTIAGIWAKAWRRAPFGWRQGLGRGALWFLLYLVMVAVREFVAFGGDHSGPVRVLLFAVGLVPAWIFWAMTPLLVVRDGGRGARYLARAGLAGVVIDGIVIALVARLVFPIILRSWEEFGPMGVAMTLLIWAEVIGTGWVLTACISAVLWEDSEATAEPVPGAEPG